MFCCCCFGLRTIMFLQNSTFFHRFKGVASVCGWACIHMCMLVCFLVRVCIAAVKAATKTPTAYLTLPYVCNCCLFIWSTSCCIVDRSGSLCCPASTRAASRAWISRTGGMGPLVRRQPTTASESWGRDNGKIILYSSSFSPSINKLKTKTGRSQSLISFFFFFVSFFSFFPSNKEINGHLLYKQALEDKNRLSVV